MGKKIFLAADGLGLDACVSLAHLLQNSIRAIKIHDVYDEHSRAAIERIRAVGCKGVWVDLKLKDIPKTVERRAKAIAKNGADVITVHADGGVDMMCAAVDGAREGSQGMVEIFAVTVLTSLTEEEVQAMYGMSSKAAVLYFARMAKLAGVQGIVCSPQEVGILALRPELNGLKFITPGVRSPGKEVHDQKRVDTPANAIKAGATHVVVGRQIVEAEDPLKALEEIEQEIS